MKTIYLVEAVRRKSDNAIDYISYQQAFEDKKKAYKVAKKYADDLRRRFRVFGKVSMLWIEVSKEHFIFSHNHTYLRGSVFIKEINYE